MTEKLKKSKIKKLREDMTAVNCTLAVFANDDVCRASERLSEFIRKIEEGELIVNEKKE